MKQYISILFLLFATSVAVGQVGMSDTGSGGSGGGGGAGGVSDSTLYIADGEITEDRTVQLTNATLKIRTVDTVGALIKQDSLYISENGLKYASNSVQFGSLIEKATLLAGGSGIFIEGGTNNNNSFPRLYANGYSAFLRGTIDSLQQIGWFIEGIDRAFKVTTDSVRFSNYGSGSITGTETYLAAFDADGNVIEVDPADYAGGGGGGSSDSILTMGGYEGLRAYDWSAYTHDVIVVADTTYTYNSISYTTKGGIFKKVSSGTENGATVIVAADGTIWEREWDRSRVIPEWWQVGGYDNDGVTVTDRKTSAGGIHDESSRLLQACEYYTDFSEGSIVMLERGKEYEITNTLRYTNLIIEGNEAILKRTDEITTTLTASVTGGSTTSISVADGSNFYAGQEIIIGTSGVQPLTGVIQSVSGNTITSSVLGGTGTKNAGELVVVAVSILTMKADGQPSTYDYTLKIDNVKFDGNKDNNSTYLFWSANSTLGFTSGGKAIITHCDFYDVPNGNIGGGGSFYLEDCTFRRLNGGVSHGSTVTTNPNYRELFSVKNCYGDSVGLEYELLDHEESIFTLSVNNINLFVENCVFENVFSSVVSADVNDNNLRFINSKFSAAATGANYITQLSASTSSSTISNFEFSHCVFENMGEFIAEGNDFEIGYSVNNVKIDNCEFLNGWVRLVNATNVEILSTRFFVDSSYAVFDTLTLAEINADRATISIRECSGIRIADCVLSYNAEYVNTWQAGIIARPLGESTANSGYFDLYNISITNTSVHNFGVGISNYGYGISPDNISTLGNYVLNNFVIDNCVAITNESNSVFQGMCFGIFPGGRLTNSVAYHRVDDDTGSYGINAAGINTGAANDTIHIAAIIDNNIVYTAQSARAIKVGESAGTAKNNIICTNNRYTKSGGVFSFRDLSNNSYVPVASEPDRNFDIFTVLTNLTNYVIPMQPIWKDGDGI